MPKLTRWGGTLFAGAAVAAACLSGGPAFAAGPVAALRWTVTPGGAVSGSAGTTLTCSSSAATGSLKSGSGLANPVGTIQTLTFSTCTGPLGISFSTSVTGPFPLNATAYNAGTGVTTGRIGKIHGSISGPLCSATVDGSSATANDGTVRAHYKNATGKLTVLTTGGNLHIYNVSGCFGLINSGDTATFSGSYTITPKQAISSP